MNLIEIALKNMSRRKAKAAFILAGLMIGVATVVAMISFSEAMTADMNNKLEKYGANIIVMPRTDNLSLSYGGLTLGGLSFETQEINQSELAGINKIKNAANVAAVGPMVMGGIQIKGQRVLLAGVDFEAFGILKPWWKIDGNIPAGNEVVLGSEAARILDSGKSRALTVEGRLYTVSGVLGATGSQDDHLVFSRIDTAQSILDKNGLVSMVEIAALCGACPVEEMVNQISEVLPGTKVMAIQQVVKGRMETLHRFQRFSFGTGMVVLFVGGLVVLVTMMGSVRERTGEIGILRAIGFRKGHIVRIIYMEAVILSSMAGMLGYAAGYAGTRAFLKIFFQNAVREIPLNGMLLGNAVVLSVIVGVVSSAYPAIMAARLDPVDSLRTL